MCVVVFSVTFFWESQESRNDWFAGPLRLREPLVVPRTGVFRSSLPCVARLQLPAHPCPGSAGSPLLPPLFRVVYSQLCVHWPACEIVACRHRALGYCLPRIVEVRYRVFSFSACKSVQVGRPWLDHDCFLRNLEPAIFVSFTLRRGAFVVQRTQHVDLLLKVSCEMHGCTYAY